MWSHDGPSSHDTNILLNFVCGHNEPDFKAVLYEKNDFLGI